MGEPLGDVEVIVDLRVEPLPPDDHRVTVTMASGAVEVACGRELDDGDPFEEVEQVLEYLLHRRAPVELVYRELHTVDPDWDARAELVRRSNVGLEEQRTEDRERRASLKDQFRRSRSGRSGPHPTC